MIGNPNNPRREQFAAAQAACRSADDRLIERLYAERDAARARLAWTQPVLAETREELARYVAYAAKLEARLEGVASAIYDLPAERPAPKPLVWSRRAAEECWIEGGVG